MIERVQQHHPKMGQKEIILLVNQALEDMSAKTKIVRDSNTFNVTADQRYYSLSTIGGSDTILEIVDVYYDYGTGKGTRIPLILNKPIERDE
jgi:hypothetical protein